MSACTGTDHPHDIDIERSNNLKAAAINYICEEKFDGKLLVNFLCVGHIALHK